MTQAISQLYEARHIEQFLGIDRNQLYHWVVTKRMVQPEIVGKGRGGRSKFSVKNLLFLSLIQELVLMGLDLNFIFEIVSTRQAINPEEAKKGKFYDIFDYFKAINPEGRIVGDSVILEIYADKDNLQVGSPVKLKWRIKKISDSKAFLLTKRGAIVVDLSHIIYNMAHRAARMKLGPYKKDVSEKEQKLHGINYNKALREFEW